MTKHKLVYLQNNVDASFMKTRQAKIVKFSKFRLEVLGYKDEWFYSPQAAPRD